MPKCKTKTSERNTPAYWEARLKRMGLTEDAGRRDWIDYGHDVATLDFDGRRLYPKEKAEEDEWPRSLC